METLTPTINPLDVESIPEYEEVSGEKRDDENIEYYVDEEGRQAWRFRWHTYSSAGDISTPH